MEISAAPALTEEMQKTIKALAMLLVTLTSRLKNTQLQLSAKQLSLVMKQIEDILNMNFKIPSKMTGQLLEGLILRFTQIADSEDVLIVRFLEIINRTLALHGRNKIQEKLVIIFLHKVVKEFTHSRKLGVKQKSSCVNTALKILKSLDSQRTESLREIFPGIISECAIQLKQWRTGKQIACGLLGLMQEFIIRNAKYFKKEKKSLVQSNVIPTSLQALLKKASPDQEKQAKSEINGLNLAIHQIEKNLKNLLTEPKIAYAFNSLICIALNSLPLEQEILEIRLFFVELKYISSKFTLGEQSSPFQSNTFGKQHYSLRSLVKSLFLSRVKHLKKYLFINLGLLQQKLILYQLEFSIFAAQYTNCYLTYEELQSIFQSLLKVLDLNYSKQLISQENKHNSNSGSTDLQQLQEEAKMFKIFNQKSENPQVAFKLFLHIVSSLPQQVKEYIIDRALSYIQDIDLKPEIKQSFKNQLYVEVNVFNINLQIKSITLLCTFIQKDNEINADGIKAILCAKLGQYQNTAALEFRAHSIYLYWMLKLVKLSMIKNPKSFVFIQNLQALSYFFQFALHPQQLVKFQAIDSLRQIASMLKLEIKDLVTYNHSALYEYCDYKLGMLQFQSFPQKVILAFHFLVEANEELTLKMGLEMIKKMEQKIDNALKTKKNQSLLLSLIAVVGSIVKIISSYYKSRPQDIASSQYSKSNYLKHILLRVRHLMVPSKANSKKPQVRKICFQTVKLFKQMMFLLSQTPLETEQKPHSFSAQDPSNVSIPNALRHIVYLLWEHIHSLIESYQDVALQKYGFELLCQISEHTEQDENYFKSMKRFDTLLEPIVIKILDLRLPDKDAIPFSTQQLLLRVMVFLKQLSKSVITEEIGRKLKEKLGAENQKLGSELKTHIQDLISIFTYN